jgi:hypothetical protein
MAHIGETTVKVKIEPEIDLTNLDDKVLDALADKIVERIQRGTVINVFPAPTYQPPMQRYMPPGQIWC